MSLLAEERRFRISEILSRERSVTAADLINLRTKRLATAIAPKNRPSRGKRND
jgi:hypothetical protein